MQVITAKPPKKIDGYIDVIKLHKFYLLLLGVLLAGMLLGALSVRYFGDGFSTFVDAWFVSFIKFRQTAGFIKIFFNCFLTGFVYIFLIGVSAFGVGGLPVLPLIMFFRGFGTCVLAGILYRNHSLQGIAFADLILLPACLAMDFILLYFSSESMNLSRRFFESIKGGNSLEMPLRPQCIDLLRKCLWCMLAVVLASLAEAAFTACFVRFFDFVK